MAAWLCHLNDVRLQLDFRKTLAKSPTKNDLDNGKDLHLLWVSKVYQHLRRLIPRLHQAPSLRSY